MRYGFRISTQRSIVSRVPPIGSPFEIIKVPSESATFLRCVRHIRHSPTPSPDNASELVPSAANRPAGHTRRTQLQMAKRGVERPAINPSLSPRNDFQNSSSEVLFSPALLIHKPIHGLERDAKPNRLQRDCAVPLCGFRFVHDIGINRQTKSFFRVFDLGNHARRFEIRIINGRPSIHCAIPCPSSTCPD